MIREDRAVVLTWKGGLGNQLFQYAAALELATELGCCGVFVTNLDESHQRLNELLGTVLEPPSIRLRRRMALYTPAHPSAVRLMQRLQRKHLMANGQLTQYDQGPAEAFDPKPHGLSRSSSSFTHISGFFQHESWFGHALAEVGRRVFEALRKDPAYALGVGSTVVAFRRGDYVRLGWELPLWYYEKALTLLPETTERTWIISDDQAFAEMATAWFKQRGIHAESLAGHADGDDIRDMSVVAAAKQVILSNSTFAWWGVTAGEVSRSGPGPVVVAPERWLPATVANPLLRPGWHTAGGEFG